MNNKHHEMIAKKVVILANQIAKGYDNEFITGTGRLLDALSKTIIQKTLEDVVDTVLADERMDCLLSFKEAFEAVGPEHIEAWIDQTINYRPTIDTALDKTPPNKV